MVLYFENVDAVLKYTGAMIRDAAMIIDVKNLLPMIKS
jgi:hypothetical protein